MPSSDLHTDLVGVLQRHGRGEDCQAHVEALASFLMHALEALEAAFERRDRWLGLQRLTVNEPEPLRLMEVFDDV